MTAREEVLGRIRRALADGPAIPDLPPVPGSNGPGDLQLFARRVEDYKAQVAVVVPEAVGAAVGAALEGVGSVAVPAGVPQEWLAEVSARVVRDDPPLTHVALDAVAAVVTGCAVAVAETGTIVLDGGPGQGRRALTLLPDRHVVVVSAKQVVSGVGEALSRLDPRRPQTWISGPSATSDIELTRVEGVHGPRRLHVVVVRSESASVQREFP